MPTGIKKPGITMAAGINTSVWQQVRSACYADRHKQTRHKYGDRHQHVCMGTSDQARVRRRTWRTLILVSPPAPVSGVRRNFRVRSPCTLRWSSSISVIFLYGPSCMYRRNIPVRHLPHPMYYCCRSASIIRHIAVIWAAGTCASPSLLGVVVAGRSSSWSSSSPGLRPRPSPRTVLPPWPGSGWPQAPTQASRQFYVDGHKHTRQTYGDRSKHTKPTKKGGPPRR